MNELTPEQLERKKMAEESVRLSDTDGPCDNNNPAIVCFAQAMLPTIQVLLKEAPSPIEGLITAIADAVCEGIDLAKHSGEWSVMAKEEFLTALRVKGFDSQLYPGETDEMLGAFMKAHPMQHTNQEQDITREKAENELAHLQDVDTAYEAGKAASAQ